MTTTHIERVSGKTGGYWDDGEDAKMEMESESSTKYEHRDSKNELEDRH